MQYNVFDFILCPFYIYIKKKRTETVISNEYNKTNLSIAPCTHDKLFYGSVSNATIVIHFFIITIIV